MACGIAAQQRLLLSQSRFQVATLTAQAHGCNVSFTWDELPYPPTVNDVAMQAMVSLTLFLTLA